MAIAPPRTLELPDRFFTLHHRANRVFALRTTMGVRTSVVGFRTWTDAEFMGKKLESSYKRNKEWPEMDATRGFLYLPATKSDKGNLGILSIKEWDLDNLRYTCTSNILDLISVEGIKTEEDKITFFGNIYKFSAPVEFYQTRFNEILTLGQ